MKYLIRSLLVAMLMSMAVVAGIMIAGASTQSLVITMAVMSACLVLYTWYFFGNE